jgi:DNA helicase IV
VPTLLELAHPDARADAIAALVRARVKRHPTTRVCVVCDSPAGAAALHAQLRDRLAALGAPVRHDHGRTFAFTPGVSVTHVELLSGLEFDDLIVAEPDEQSYPHDERGRRRLYAVATRAKGSLAFVAARPPCAWLTSALAAGALVRIAANAPPAEG